MIAALYARKSTEQAGVADEQKSVARQIEHARAFASTNGWTIAEAHIYVDDGVSGAEFANRPGLVRLLAALGVKGRPAPFQVLIVSDLDRLGREQVETGYVLKQIVSAGVRVFAYLDGREIALDSPLNTFLMQVQAFGANLEREKARQRTYDTMQRKARAGHVTGGRLFGYVNVDVAGADGRRSHVERTIVEEEATIIRDIFSRCVRGEGFKTIARALNDATAPAPKAQGGRSTGWSPSSVREVLYRETYAGRIVWNRTRKRDAWGRQRQTDRPSSEWVTVDAEPLRIVSDALWHAAHVRLDDRRDRYQRWRQDPASGAPDGRGVRRQYFLTGFSRCVCGGSMQVVSRPLKAGRDFRYLCSTYWNRGAAQCGNGLPVDMLAADLAVRTELARVVLQPRIIDRALDVAVRQLRDAGSDGAIAGLQQQLATVERELANLAAAAARGGAVPAILDALSAREAERRRLTFEMDRRRASSGPNLSTAALRARLRGFLAEWQTVLRANVAEARDVLSVVLADRIQFRPDAAARRYTLTLPLAFDRVLIAAVPELQGLQDQGSSPAGVDSVLRAEYLIELPAA